jgi:RluA family pseudouridine synthase
MIEWTISPAEAGLSLLEALQHRVPAAPRAYLHQLCKKQRIRYADDPATASTIVAMGAHIQVSPVKRLVECIDDSRLLPEQILHEDRECIVIHKPAGLLVHPAPGHQDDLLTRLQTFLRLRGERFQVAAVQRLDIGTSGPVMFGKGRAAIRLLGQMFMDGQVIKGYLALVDGEPPERGTLQSPVPAHGRYRSALLHFRRLGRCDAGSILEIRLATGRQHQIRRQLAEAGWPLVGDRRYGQSTTGNLLLHCHLLAFRQPVSATEVRIEPPLPRHLADLLGQFDHTSVDSSAWREISAPSS